MSAGAHNAPVLHFLYTRGIDKTFLISKLVRTNVIIASGEIIQLREKICLKKKKVNWN